MTKAAGQRRCFRRRHRRPVKAISGEIDPSRASTGKRRDDEIAPVRKSSRKVFWGNSRLAFSRRPNRAKRIESKSTRLFL